MEEHKNKQMDKKKLAEDYAREYEAERKRVYKPKEVTVKAKSHPLHGFPRDRRFDFPAGGDDPSQPEAKRLLPPPGASIWKGNETRSKMGSWNVHLPPWPRYSKSWVAAGSEREALKLVLEFVW